MLFHDMVSPCVALIGPDVIGVVATLFVYGTCGQIDRNHGPMTG